MHDETVSFLIYALIGCLKSRMKSTCEEVLISVMNREEIKGAVET